MATSTGSAVKLLCASRSLRSATQMAVYMWLLSASKVELDRPNSTDLYSLFGLPRSSRLLGYTALRPKLQACLSVQVIQAHQRHQTESAFLPCCTFPSAGLPPLLSLPFSTLRLVAFCQPRSGTRQNNASLGKNPCSQRSFRAGVGERHTQE